MLCHLGKDDTPYRRPSDDESEGYSSLLVKVGLGLSTIHQNGVMRKSLDNGG